MYSLYVMIFIYCTTEAVHNENAGSTSISYTKLSDRSVSENEQFLPNENIPLSEPSSTSKYESSVFACATKPCLRKCCRDNEHIVDSKCSIVNESRFQIPPVHDPQVPESNRSSHFKIFYGFPCLGNIQFDNENSLLHSNGTLLIDDGSGFNESQFCYEYNEEVKSTIPYVCLDFVETDAQTEFVRFTMYYYSMLLSIFCLTITFLVYVAVPNLRCKLRNQCLLCYILSLIFCYLNLMYIQARPTSDVSWYFLCVLAPYSTQFSLSASFFWLNVMCIEVWLMVRNRQIFQNSKGKQLFLYCIYAWGCPVVICLVTYLAEISWMPGDLIKPNFDEETCWFRSDRDDDVPFYADPKFWYLYFVLSIILLVNVFAFIRTAFLLFLKERKWIKCERVEMKRHRKRQINRFTLYLKLFLVMGITWIMEVVSYFVGGSLEVWIFTDVVNALQGFIIFIMLCWDRKILVALNKKLYPGFMLIEDRKSSVSRRTLSSKSSGIESVRSSTKRRNDSVLKGLPPSTSEDFIL